nr:uncharacterized protein LOC109757652 [Aegilops tauschii subsp. strangulata]
MTREWGDNAGRPKRGLDDRRAPSRSSPEGLRREADLRRELDSRAPRRSPPREARLSPSHDRRRSPARDGRRSPPRDDRRDRPRSPVVEARQSDRRRSPSPERHRARSPSLSPTRDQPPCFNYGIAGHYQVECTNLPMCYLCKDTGHPAALCPDRPLTDELMMYGHGIEGLRFFHIEVDDLPPPSPSLQAIVTVVGVGVASSEMIEAKLNHLCRRVWDWQVTPTSASSFTVVFPDAISLGLCTRSDDITLALNKLVVNISEPKADPKAVAVLDTAWILIAGLPDVARSERVIHSMSKILGKVVVVDELSLRKEEEVRVKVKCLDSDKLRVTVRVFFNDLGFDLNISPEPPNHVGRPRFSDDGHFGGGGTDRRDDSHYRRPRPSCHEDPDDDDELSGHSRSPSRDPTPAVGEQALARAAHMD